MWLPLLPSVSIVTNQILAINNAERERAREKEIGRWIEIINALVKSTGVVP